jgi:hypothetical protein
MNPVHTTSSSLSNIHLNINFSPKSRSSYWSLSFWLCRNITFKYYLDAILYFNNLSFSSHITLTSTYSSALLFACLVVKPLPSSCFRLSEQLKPKVCSQLRKLGLSEKCCILRCCTVCFVDYLETLLALSRYHVYRRMVYDDLEMDWKEVVVAYSKFYSGVCLDGLTNSTKKLTSIRIQVREFTSRPTDAM